MLEIFIGFFVFGVVYQLFDQMESKYSLPLSLFLFISAVGWLYGEKPKATLEYIYVPFVEGVSVLKSKVVGSNTNASTSKIASSPPIRSSLPADQEDLVNLVEQAARQASAMDDRGAKKQVWINLNRRLCLEGGEQGIFERKNDWIAEFAESFVADDGELMRFHVRLSENFTISLEESETISPEILVGASSGKKVRISGFFVRGNMNENECLNARNGFYSSPEIDEYAVEFRFTDIELVE